MKLSSSESSKCKEAVFYICKMASFNEYQIHKNEISQILFLSDREKYLKTFSPMITDSYIKGKYGPYLEDINQIIDDLSDYMGKTEYMGKFDDYYFMKRELEIKALSKEDLDIINDNTLNVLYNKKEIEKIIFNHHWKVARNKEYIPMCVQLISPTSHEITDDDIKWALDSIE